MLSAGMSGATMRSTPFSSAVEMSPLIDTHRPYAEEKASSTSKPNAFAHEIGRSISSSASVHVKGRHRDLTAYNIRRAHLPLARHVVESKRQMPWAASRRYSHRPRHHRHDPPRRAYDIQPHDMSRS